VKVLDTLVFPLKVLKPPTIYSPAHSVTLPSPTGFSTVHPSATSVKSFPVNSLSTSAPGASLATYTLTSLNPQDSSEAA